ncbi:hypothetical protein ACT3RR_16555 [Ewingella sp. AOP8-B2-18]
MDTLRHSRSTPAHWLKIVQSGLSTHLPLSPSLRLNNPYYAAKNLVSSFTPAWGMR